MPSEYSSARSAKVSSCSAFSPPAGILMRCILNVHVMKLEILPRGHVRDAVGILLCQVRQSLKLLRVQPSRGDFDALHPRSIPHRIRTLGQFSGRIAKLLNRFAVVPLTVVIALAIDSSSEARFGEKALVDLALLSQSDFRFKDVYFTCQTLRYFSGESFGPGRVRDLHLAFASITRYPQRRPGSKHDSPTLQQSTQFPPAI